MKGVSPLIAEIILIAIVFSVATAVIVVLGRTNPSIKVIDAKLGVDGFEWKSQRIVIYHLGGDTIGNAFEACEEEFSWKDLVVKISGREVKPLNPLFNGKPPGYFIYESMVQPPSGRLKNDASYNARERWVQLTPRENRRIGHLEYVLDPPPTDFVVEFQFRIGGGRENALWFYAFCENTPLRENGENSGGYTLVYCENHDNMYVYYNGRLLASENVSPIGDDRWRDARIVFNGMFVEMYMDNLLFDNMIRYIDWKIEAERRKEGTLFGWAARTLENLPCRHLIRNLRVWPIRPRVYDFSPGQVLEFRLKDPLVVGDAITIIYKPQNKLLYMNDIS